MNTMNNLQVLVAARSCKFESYPGHQAFLTLKGASLSPVIAPQTAPRLTTTTVGRCS